MDWHSDISSLLDAGGFTMPPLLGCAFLLWYTLGIRMMTLQRGHRRSIRGQIRQRMAHPDKGSTGPLDGAIKTGLQLLAMYPAGVPRSVIAEHFTSVRLRWDRGRVTIRSVVAVAPLLGLLGTVTGMIETFRSLADMALFTQGGGIAGGIAEALLTTQMGLAVSVPGLICGQMLDRKQAALESELQQLEEWLSAGETMEAVA